MKLKNLRGVLVAGILCLPLPGFGQDAITALRQKAEQGNAEAQYYLGLAYYRGNGVPQDYKEAVKWYRLAAEQGDVNAQKMLSFLKEKSPALPAELPRVDRAVQVGDPEAQIAATLGKPQGSFPAQGATYYMYEGGNIGVKDGKVVSIPYGFEAAMQSKQGEKEEALRQREEALRQREEALQQKEEALR